MLKINANTTGENKSDSSCSEVVTAVHLDRLVGVHDADADVVALRGVAELVDAPAGGPSVGKGRMEAPAGVGFRGGETAPWGIADMTRGPYWKQVLLFVLSINCGATAVGLFPVMAYTLLFGTPWSIECVLCEFIISVLPLWHIIASRPDQIKQAGGCSKDLQGGCFRIQGSNWGKHQKGFAG